MFILTRGKMESSSSVSDKKKKRGDDDAKLNWINPKTLGLPFWWEREREREREEEWERVREREREKMSWNDGYALSRESAIFKIQQLPMAKKKKQSTHAHTLSHRRTYTWTTKCSCSYTHPLACSYTHLQMLIHTLANAHAHTCTHNNPLTILDFG